MNLVLHVWRQANADAAGKMVVYQADDINPDMAFLEMLDVVNERLTERGEVPIAFDHDCREGICGSCSLMINGDAHGPMKGTRDVPAPHAELQGRRHDLHRAVASPGLSSHQGSCGRSLGVGPDHSGRRIHHGANR